MTRLFCEMGEHLKLGNVTENEVRFKNTIGETQMVKKSNEGEKKGKVTD